MEPVIEENNINVVDIFQKYCQKLNIPFNIESKVNPYDDTTLFCPAGMQQFKPMFKDVGVTDYTTANVQSCIRVNDYDEIGDGTHLIYFNMIGLFSFRHLSVPEAINFWTNFIENELNLTIGHVTIHPDKLDEWSIYYQDDDKNVKYKIIPDEECTWSDGNGQEAYCTEFYIDDIEIGNIVNPMGDCIDAGFGLERLDMLVNKHKYVDKGELMKEAIRKIVNSGYVPGYKEQGYILRKLLRDLYKYGYNVDNDDPIYNIYMDEVNRQNGMLDKYNKMKDTKKGRNKTRKWWYETQGVDLDLLGIQ